MKLKMSFLLCLALLFSGCSTTELVVGGTLTAIGAFAHHEVTNESSRQQRSAQVSNSRRNHAQNSQYSTGNNRSVSSPSSAQAKRSAIAAKQAMTNLEDAVKFLNGGDYEQAYEKFQVIDYKFLSGYVKAKAWIYRSICAVCHGRNGDARSSILIARNLNSDAIRSPIFDQYNPEIQRRLYQMLP